MKRFHVHVGVADLDASIRFYSTLFGAAPAVAKVDYAKWMLDDPRINFAISQRGSRHGVNHLGIQVDSDGELAAMREQLATADAGMTVEEGANCCYAKSDKVWTTDPQGVAWETFHSLGAIPFFDGEASGTTGCGGVAPAEGAASPASKAACCTPPQKAVAPDAPRAKACCA